MGGTRARILMCHQIATNRNSNTLRNLLQTDHQRGPITAQLHFCRFHNRSTVLHMCSLIFTHFYFESKCEGDRGVIWSFFSYWFSTTLAWCVCVRWSRGFKCWIKPDTLMVSHDVCNDRSHFLCYIMVLAISGMLRHLERVRMTSSLFATHEFRTCMPLASQHRSGWVNKEWVIKCGRGELIEWAWKKLT